MKIVSETEVMHVKDIFKVTLSKIPHLFKTIIIALINFNAITMYKLWIEAKI